MHSSQRVNLNSTDLGESKEISKFLLLKTNDACGTHGVYVISYLHKKTSTQLPAWIDYFTMLVTQFNDYAFILIANFRLLNVGWFICNNIMLVVLMLR